MTRLKAAALVLFVAVLGACGADDRPIAYVGTSTTTEQATTTTVAPTTTTEAVTTTTEPEAPATTVQRVRPATTVPAAPRATVAPVPAAPRSAATTGTGACGGDLPPCTVLSKESGGDITVVSPYGLCDGGDGRCHGKWQFDLDTWESLGRSGLPEDHSEAEQDAAARDLMARDGCGQWSTC